VSVRYKHALCLHPYFRDSHSGSLGLAIFPPVGLEYIAAALTPVIEKVTFLDLRVPGPLRDPQTLVHFVSGNIDLICVSINWEYHFSEVCQLINSLPRTITTVVGGKQATDNVEAVFDACPGVDMVVRGEGEESIVEIARGMDSSGIRGISYRSAQGLVHNENRPLPEVDVYRFPDRSLRSQSYHMNIGGHALRGLEFDMRMKTSLSIRTEPGEFARGSSKTAFKRVSSSSRALRSISIPRFWR